MGGEGRRKDSAACAGGGDGGRRTAAHRTGKAAERCDRTGEQGQAEAERRARCLAGEGWRAYHVARNARELG